MDNLAIETSELLPTVMKTITPTITPISHDPLGFEIMQHVKEEDFIKENIWSPFSCDTGVGSDSTYNKIEHQPYPHHQPTYVHNELMSSSVDEDNSNAAILTVPLVLTNCPSIPMSIPTEYDTNKFLSTSTTSSSPSLAIENGYVDQPALQTNLKSDKQLSGFFLPNYSSGNYVDGTSCATQQTNVLEILASSCSSIQSFEEKKTKNIKKKKKTEKKPTTLKSHTRKCREKVSRQLENLSNVLPKPKNANTLRHKGALLEYTIDTIKKLIQTRIELQASIALSSVSSLQQWVINTLQSQSQSQPSLHSLIESFIKLYCLELDWTYAEFWERNLNLISSYICNEQEHSELQRFSKLSKAVRYHRNDTSNRNILNRVMMSGTAEWVDEIGLSNDQFDRYRLTANHGLKCIQVVPIILFDRQCIGCTLFADANDRSPRRFDVSALQKLKDYLTIIAEQYRSYTAKTSN